MHSIRWKIILAYLAIIVFAFFVVSATMISMTGEYLFSQKSKQEQRVAQALAAEAASVLSAKDADALYLYTQQASQESGSRVLIIDTYGVVQCDALGEYDGQQLAFSEVADALQSRESAYGFYSLFAAEQRYSKRRLYSMAQGKDVLGLYVCPVLSDAGECLGALLYVSDCTDVYEGLTAIVSRMYGCMALLSVVVLLVSVLITRTFTKPVAVLNQGISRMAQGDLSTRVPIQGKNEFGQLAQAFNAMSERLEATDKTRNEFVSNASHELKTPLATMKLLVETLLYQEEIDPALTKEFLGDINSEIDRLSSIVGDLLTLVHFDSGKTQKRVSREQMDALLRDTCRRLLPLAQSKGIQLQCAVQDKIECLIDSRKMEQVFYNLLDNAIKYTPEGGRVDCSIERNRHMAVIRVTDTGIGIPQSECARIFDRFYRVDKARARGTGGTGLGLAIVKEIVLLHGGSIHCDSRENAGSTFTVEIPIVNI